MKRTMVIIGMIVFCLICFCGCVDQSQINYDELDEFLHIYSYCNGEFMYDNTTSPFDEEEIDYTKCFMNAYRYVSEQNDKQYSILLDQLTESKAAEIINEQTQYKDLLNFIDSKSKGNDQHTTLKEYLKYIASFDVAQYYYSKELTGDFNAQDFLNFIQQY